MRQPESMFFQTIDCHQIPLNVSSYEQALREVEHLIELKDGFYICFFEANLFSCAMMDENVRNTLKRAALIYCDGIAPAKSSSWGAGIRMNRVSGPTFLLKACEYGIAKEWRHFFFGGAEGVSEKLAAKLSEKYPGLKIAGTYSPPFRSLTDAEEKELKRMIDESHADILWVGLGGPKQEFWMNKHLGKINVPVMLGVGAAFDFHSGNCPWAPKIIRNSGLEWLWRMFSGGRKTFFRNLKCVPKVFCILLMDFLKYRILFARKNPVKSKYPSRACRSSENITASSKK